MIYNKTGGRDISVSEAVNILFDLNIDGDCTNLGSLAVLHRLADLGEARILATTACFGDPLAAGCIKALNRYYGREYLPVGILHSQPATHPTPFMAPVNRQFCPEAPEGADVPDTVEIMRRALIKEADNSVVFVISGCFASAAALFASGADDISPLSGIALAEKKIRRIVVMAGSFDTLGDEVFPENNVSVQVPAAQYVTGLWKKELVLSAYEIGIRTLSLKEFRFHGSDSHPLKMMYIINDGDGFSEGNPSWDHTAVLEGVRPGRYFDYHETGRINVTGTGITEWVNDKTCLHTYLLPKVPFDEIAAEINDLIFPQWRDYRK